MEMNTEVCFFGLDWFKLDWSRVKVNPFVSSLREKLQQQRPMPLNIFQDKDGLPRILLTEPNGSSAEV